MQARPNLKSTVAALEHIRDHLGDDLYHLHLRSFPTEAEYIKGEKFFHNLKMLSRLFPETPIILFATCWLAFQLHYDDECLALISLLLSNKEQLKYLLQEQLDWLDEVIVKIEAVKMEREFENQFRYIEQLFQERKNDLAVEVLNAMADRYDDLTEKQQSRLDFMFKNLPRYLQVLRGNVFVYDVPASDKFLGVTRVMPTPNMYSFFSKRHQHKGQDQVSPASSPIKPGPR